jgi:hypothetical protein
MDDSVAQSGYLSASREIWQRTQSGKAKNEAESVGPPELVKANDFVPSEQDKPDQTRQASERGKS